MGVNIFFQFNLSLYKTPPKKSFFLLMYTKKINEITQKENQISTKHVDRGSADQRKRASAGSIQRSCEVASNTAQHIRAGSLQSISSSEGSS